MSISSPAAAHPIMRCVEQVGAALDEASESEPLYLPVREKAAALVQLEREVARLRALQLRILAVSDEVAAETGARSAGAWLAQQVPLGHADAARADRLAVALEVQWHQVGAAFAAGRLTEAQTATIVRALDALPESAGQELRERAEAHLVVHAAHLDPRQLRLLGRRVLELVAPEVAEAQEYEQLLAEEQRSRQATRLSIFSRGDGSSELRGVVPDHVAGRLRVYLEAIASPRRAGTAEPERARLVGPERLGQAFCTLLERLPSDALPQHGASATTVMVLIDLDRLRAEVGVGETGNGDRLTAEEVRRLACNARIVPAVLGRKSEVLDLGRSARLFSPAQRTAMVVRDRQCREEGCSIPAAWCEAHHWHPWSRGGRTNLKDGVLLCSWHHHRAHDERYEGRRLPNGDVRFTRRT